MTKSVYRILDANFNRSREALRVLEEFARFHLDDSMLTERCKTLRHTLQDVLKQFDGIAGQSLACSRDTVADVGTSMSNSSEELRDDLAAVVTANVKRLQESFRVIEEYGKRVDSSLAAQVKSLRYEMYTFENICMRHVHYAGQLKNPLMVICTTDTYSTQVEAVLAAACEAKLGFVQLRMKDLPTAQMLDLARQVNQRLATSDTSLIINDRVDIANAVGSGVHLGSDDMPIAEARKQLGQLTLIGATAHSVGQARDAVAAGADYIGAGAAFASSTKSAAKVRGVDHIAQISQAVSCPVFAIGGIGSDNIAELAAQSITHFAVGSALTLSDNPQAVIYAMQEQLAVTF